MYVHPWKKKTSLRTSLQIDVLRSRHSMEVDITKPNKERPRHHHLFPSNNISRNTNTTHISTGTAAAAHLLSPRCKPAGPTNCGRGAFHHGPVATLAHKRKGVLVQQDIMHGSDRRRRVRLIHHNYLSHAHLWSGLGSRDILSCINPADPKHSCALLLLTRISQEDRLVWNSPLRLNTPTPQMRPLYLVIPGDVGVTILVCCGLCVVCGVWVARCVTE